MATEQLPPTLAGYRPTQNEKEASQFLFKKADTEALGVLTGDTAVPFFNHSGLPLPILGEVWQISDPENSGFLTPERFGVACRLIGHAQAEGGVGDVKPEWLTTPGPLPCFEGFAIPAHLLPPQGVVPPRSPIQAQGTGGSGTTGTAGNSITPEEKAKYAKLFAAAQPVNGLLDGDSARTIFIKSKLPFDTLGKIWNLADTHSRGSLDVADFTIGMHLIQHTMNGALPTLPNVLNPSLYASALALQTGPGSSAPASRILHPPTSPLRQSSAALQPVIPQNTGSYSAPAYSAFRPPPPSPRVLPWDITAQEKGESDNLFDGIDTARRGAIEGEAAVGFFSQSGLPIDKLAQVWDLADIRQSGALNKDEFAVALKLIRDNLAGKALPQVLPLSMTPPSLRQAPAAAPPPPQRNLLDFDDDEPATLSPQGTGLHPALSPQSTGQLQPPTIFPQSTGSRTLSPQTTGQNYPRQPSSGSSQSPAPSSQGVGYAAQPRAAIVPPSPAGNFFDDNDDADQSAKLSADSVTLGNLQNEYTSTNRAVEKLASTRGELEASLSSTTSAINELQVKLSQARAAHETERKMVDDLQSRHKDQASLLARQRTELITAESDLSALRVERTEIEGNYLRDKEDVRDMKKKMAEVAAETALIKEEIEKKKKEARQQKGLVAISKKQLSTAEAEKDKAAAALVEAEREASAPVPEDDEDDSPFDFHSAIPLAATVALPASPAVVSPTSSVRSTNPFDRLGAIAAVSSPLASPSPTPTASPPPSISPVATIAAVGAGAVVAATALGAGVAGILGVKHEESSEVTPTPSPAPVETKEEADPFGFPASTSQAAASQEEVDPFGLPVSAATASSSSAFDSSFDDGFGDDFSAAPVAQGSSAFDDAFAELEPEAEPEPAPVVPPPPTVEEKEASAIEEPDPKKEVVEEPVAEQAAVEEPEPVAQETPAAVDEPIQHEEEPDSSDDEDEIEDAAPLSHHSPRELSLTDSTASPHVGTSTSDSGESFVHVSAPTEEAESKFPALETLPEPTVLPSPVSNVAVERSVSPGSELDTFEDAPTMSDSTFLPTSSTLSADPAVHKKRPAPPPPPGAKTPLPSSAAPTPPPAAVSDFDSAFSFDTPPVAVQTTGSSKFVPAASDDFDSAFADLPPPVAPVSTGTSASTARVPDADFDSFEDDDFSFKPTFDAPSTQQSTSAFDSAFSDFDKTFEPASSTVDHGASRTDSPFSFDDTFGSSTTGTGTNLAASLGVPGGGEAAPGYTAAAPPAPTPALDDDVDGVKQIVGMGFSRSQAIAALEKNNYNVSHAINSMLN